MSELLNRDITINGLRRHYQNGDFTPRELISKITTACDQVTDNPIWITRLTPEQLNIYVERLETQAMDDLPLWGIPFAVKDNIDLANIPTTAACPDFTYTPTDHAFVVQQLINAGAIPIGKTNMDQFATGLVGVRSPEPWGPCKNAFDDAIISGGSSSGSGVAVSLGLVSFSLGTDTAGSGRIPASLNNIVGLKPSRGLLSNRGVVPACKSMDCISIFALTADDANTVLDVAAKADTKEPYSRVNRYDNGQHYFGTDIKNRLTIGVPQLNQCDFFGNKEAQAIYEDKIERLKKIANIKEMDFSPLFEAAKLLYEGPWVSERKIAIEGVEPHSLLPVIDTIINQSVSLSAEEVFLSSYRLAELKQLADELCSSVDVMLTPTAGTYYYLNDVLNNPIQLNSNLGYYTNFMNLLDYAAVSVPVGQYENGVGFGVTVFSHAFTDKYLLSIARNIQQQFSLQLGATTLSYHPKELSTQSVAATIDVVVCGAHLEGLALNWQLSERGAKLVQKTTTSPHYRFYALAGGPPKRPGLIRDSENGAAIEIEVWRVPKANFGSFVAEIPHPLGIGKVELADTSWCSGFICETAGLEGADDITEFGSWRKYLGQL